MFYDDVIDSEVEKALQEYSQKFKDDFPLMEFEGNKKQLISIIKKCIKKNKEFFVKYDENEED